MTGRTTTERILDAYLAPEADRLADRVLGAALDDIARTPQRRALRSPWRFPLMPALTRTTSLAAVALVAAIGVGGLIYVNSTGPAGPGLTSSPPPASAASSPSPAPASPNAIPAATGFAGFSSTVYPRLVVRYPAGWVSTAASRAWQVGDVFPADALPYADRFVSPGEGSAQVGLFVWEMPVDGPPDSFALLKPWAEQFCHDVLTSVTSCQDFTKNATPMCHLLSDGCDAGDGAILVPTAGAQYAFFRTWQSDLFDSTTVRVVVIAREDGFPAAAPYGGSVALLKSVLTPMHVWTPGQEPAP